MAELAIVEALEGPRVDAARRLFREYADALGVDLRFQGLDEELARLPGAYAPPSGRLLLGLADGEAVACVALRALGADVCEMKRLYVRPAFRGSGLGRRLARAALAEARAIGYARMRLDTLASMDAARRLYESLGFVEIEPYYENPLEGTRYLELAL